MVRTSSEPPRRRGAPPWPDAPPDQELLDGSDEAEADPGGGGDVGPEGPLPSASPGRAAAVGSPHIMAAQALTLELDRAGRRGHHGDGAAVGQGAADEDLNDGDLDIDDGDVGGELSTSLVRLHTRQDSAATFEGDGVATVELCLEAALGATPPASGDRDGSARAEELEHLAQIVARQLTTAEGFVEAKRTRSSPRVRTGAPQAGGPRVFLTPLASSYLLPYGSNSGAWRSSTVFVIVLTPLTP